VQKQLWRNLKYQEHMRQAHRHLNHRKEVVDFVIRLLQKNSQSLREIARQTNTKFNLRICHDTISHWKEMFGIHSEAAYKGVGNAFPASKEKLPIHLKEDGQSPTQQLEASK